MRSFRQNIVERIFDIMYKDIEINISAIKNLLPVDDSFDIILRELYISSTRACLLFIDGFAKDDVMVHVMKELQGAKPEQNKDVFPLLLQKIPYIEVSRKKDIEEAVNAVLCGQIMLIVDGCSTAALIDAREYPAREPSQSHIEKVTRGPRDDLVETVVFNTALIRRRIRNRSLTFKMCTVGNDSKTDVAVGYLGDRADKKLVKSVVKKLESIDVPALTMGEKSLEELLVKKRWYNPLPIFRVSERPDTIAAHLVEGHIVIIVDTSPTALILPASVFYFTQYIEDYFQPPLIGTITRLFRFLAIFFATYAIPLYMLICRGNLPIADFLIPQADKYGALTMFWQLALLELGLEGLKMSSLHTPQNLQAAFSIIGGLILGDLGVSIGVFSPNAIFLSVASAIANHCVPNPELGNAVRIFRWLGLILSALLGWYGFALNIIYKTVLIVTTKTFDRTRRYTWPLYPFNLKALLHLLFRYPAYSVEGKDEK